MTTLHKTTAGTPWAKRSAHGLDVDPGEDWRSRAACRDDDPETWFPTGSSGPALAQTEQAKAVCRRCPVVDECLTWALDQRVEFGVWGGMTEAERAPLVKIPAAARPTKTCQQCGRKFRPRGVQQRCASCQHGGLLKPCGTLAAYNRHLKRREAPCAACREARRLRSVRQRERQQRALEESGASR